MKITKIGFGYTKNLGNYENCKVWLEADLEDWENPSESLDVLRTRVAEELELPHEWHELKHQLAKQMASIETFNSIIESKKIQLAKAEEVWDNFAEFLTAHGVDASTLKIENFAATRADHLPSTPLAEYVADDSAELGFGELDTSDDSYDDDDDDDDDYDDDDY
ncbi:hypothetical protein [Microcoleus sp. herbarium5]|uniref:hypothetical protein n=1 Tax=Microcoleus sp. herbarium5 TaxID=3055434 RepID=UPI002FD25683